MKLNRTAAGHLAAFVTILIWGTTFISTKVLLRTFSPVEILFIRFVMGYLALWLVCPRSLRLSLPLSWVGCSWEERGRVSGSLPDFCLPWQASA